MAKVERLTASEGAKIQAIVDDLVAIRVYLECLSGNGRTITGWLRRYKFVLSFSQSGSISIVDWKGREPEFDHNSIEPIYEYARFVKQEANSTVDHLAGVTSRIEQLGGTITSLPDRAHDRLSRLPGRSGDWITHVTRCLMLPVSQWVRLPSREAWHPNISKHPRQPYLPTRFDYFLEYFTEADPTDFWQRLCRRIDAYILDLVAVGRRLSIEIKPEGSGRGRPRSEKVTVRREKVAKLHEDGVSPGEIAAKLGVSTTTIRKDIERIGAALKS